MPDTFCQPLPPRGCSGDGPDAVRRMEWGRVRGFAKFGVVVKGACGVLRGREGLWGCPRAPLGACGAQGDAGLPGVAENGMGGAPPAVVVAFGCCLGCDGGSGSPPDSHTRTRSSHPGYGVWHTSSLPRFPSCKEKGVQPLTENPSALQPVLP